MMKSLIVFITLVIFGFCILDRSYYKTLRVPISAGSEEIKAAYRKLSRKYHPDRNQNSRIKFENINVAYQTLANEQTKYLYDRLGKQKMNDPNIQRQVNLGSLKGSTIQIPLIVKLEDLYSGKTLQATIFKQMACEHCLGSGAQNQYDIVRCSDCQGQGKKTKKVHVGGGYYNMMQQKCQRCKGEGKIVGRKCQTCSGNKIISGAETFKVQIVPGTKDYQRFNFINMGDQLMEGAPGDVIVIIKQAPHQNFTRMGDQLHTNIYISLQQALFGFQRKIKQLDGRQITVQKTSITQPNQIIVVKNQGMPIKGTEYKAELIVKVNVQIQDFNSKQLEKLKETLGTISEE